MSAEKRISNLSDVIKSLNTSLQRAQETAKEVEKMRFAVENNKDQLISASEALKQMSVVDSLSRSVAMLKCSLDRIVNNSTHTHTHTHTHSQIYQSTHSQLSLSERLSVCPPCVLSCPSGSGVAACCPPGWDQFDFNCYHFSRSSLSWNESRVWCEKNEAHLLILHSDKAWDFVNRRTASSFHWVGLSDWRTGRWEWINQTPYTMERRRWMPGQPDGWSGHGLGHEVEHCAHLHHDGRLNDLHCSTKMRFICQRHSMN
ncbi:C-type lectin domain family 10 member A-like [Xyrichtys novacula]|nr:C-type lectin domain family 10 member A-like [Xyrichtys novacula]